jgi:hypothetical protein
MEVLMVQWDKWREELLKKQQMDREGQVGQRVAGSYQM